MAYHFLSYDSYRRICNVIHTLDDVIANINDNYEATNIVWSSQKIMEMISNLETEIDLEIDSNISNKVTLSIDTCPAEEDMELNKLYFEPKTDVNGETYYDNYIKINNIGKLFLGSSIFEKDKYYTKSEMDERYAPINYVNKLSSFAPIDSRTFYRIMNQDAKVCNDKFLSTHDNLAIPNVSQEGLIIGSAFPIGDGYILETYRNGMAYWSVKLVRGDYNLADESPSAVKKDTLISEILSNKDEFGLACAAWPELMEDDLHKSLVSDQPNVNYPNGWEEEWCIPLHSKLMYVDDKFMAYKAALVIKNEPAEKLGSDKVSLYLRAGEEIPPGTVLYGSTCFTINHTR